MILVSTRLGTESPSQLLGDGDDVAVFVVGLHVALVGRQVERARLVDVPDCRLPTLPRPLNHLRKESLQLQIRSCSPINTLPVLQSPRWPAPVPARSSARQSGAAESCSCQVESQVSCMMWPPCQLSRWPSGLRSDGHSVACTAANQLRPLQRKVL